MTIAELKKRVEALEAALAELRVKQEAAPALQRARWCEDAGRFANDPGFDEIVRLGREYRVSLYPDKNRKPRSRKRGNS